MVHEELGYCQVYARWVPRRLAEDHKNRRFEVALHIFNGLKKKKKTIPGAQSDSQ
jgi:hypothetical protein